jgi:hypothetical protein
MLRNRYLKEHRRTTYFTLLASERLNQHLAEINELIRDSVSRLVKEMALTQGVDESMKARDPMAWVGAINAIKVQAEEIALKKLIYFD